MALPEGGTGGPLTPAGGVTGGPPSPGSTQTLEDLGGDAEWTWTPAAQSVIKDTFHLLCYNVTSTPGRRSRETWGLSRLTARQKMKDSTVRTEGVVTFSVL